MPTIKLTKDVEVRTGPASRRVYPAGWKGDAGDAVVAAARRAGALAGGADADGAGESGADMPRLDELTVKEMIALATALPAPVDLGDAKKKADILAAYAAAGHDAGVRADWRAIIAGDGAGDGGGA